MPAKVRRRGGVSTMYAKRSYSINLKGKYSIAGLPIDDDWILNANYIDKTFMRHKISFDLFRQMSPKNIASKCSYINVKVNDEDQGLYVLMEKIDASMIGLNKKDSLSMLFKDPPIFYKEKLSYVQDSLNYYHQKFPNKSKDDKTEYVERFVNFLYNSTDSDFVDSVSYWIDVENIIDWHLILLFSNNGDGVQKNFYLYKLNAETPFRIAIWDYDHSFGRNGGNGLNMMTNELDCTQSVLLKRLMGIVETGYSTDLKKRWFQHRKNVISANNFNNLIVENDKIVSKAIPANFELWPIDSHWYKDDNSYNKELKLMQEFVTLRLNYLDAYFSDLE
jgi:hypothetical protein